MVHITCLHGILAKSFQTLTIFSKPCDFPLTFSLSGYFQAHFIPGDADGAGILAESTGDHS